MSTSTAESIINEVKKHVVGKDRVLRLILAAFLADGHVLIDDIPGVGKTTMAVSFVQAMGLNFRRTQFTPDVLPSDILGFSLYDKQKNAMVFNRGAVFCNVFLADEINRTSPKTQSALLEAMEERQVSVDGHTYPLDQPFFVLATQNPTGSAGTEKLPESETDRFMICVSMGYPTLEEECEILKRKHAEAVPTTQVADRESVAKMRAEVKEVFVHDAIYNYLSRLIQATRENEYIDLGGSPRATISLMHMSMAIAYLNGRNYVIPEDVAEVFVPVMNHRIIRSRKALAEKVSEEKILEGILSKERKPTQKKG